MSYREEHACPPGDAASRQPSSFLRRLPSIERKELLKLAVPEGNTGLLSTAPLRVGLVLDVETTGRRSGRHKIIELALRRFKFGSDGRIVQVGKLYSWREDPGHSLHPRISQLTGLYDHDLVGQILDDAAIVKLLKSASIIIAHNAAFDRPFVEARLTEASGLAWCCSMSEIDWLQWGMDGRGLGWLVAQTGWYFDPHRAGNDVDALLCLLCHGLADNRPVLAHLAESAARVSYRVEATGAAYEVKDDLSDNDYHWDPRGKVWWKNVPEASLTDKQFWLASNVYQHLGTRAFGPTVTEMTAAERYA